VVSDRVDQADVNPLVSLLHQCVVRIDRDGEFSGTGFFVAPREVLTCAHVVHGGSEIAAGWACGSSAVTAVDPVPKLEIGDPKEQFYPFPDVALLRLAQPPETHPCVQFDTAEPVAGPPASALRLAAWTIDAYAPDTAVLTSATVEVEGRLELDSNRLMKLRDGQIVRGFSGAPLLNPQTGAVCGHVESSRDLRSDLGGYGVPLAAVLDALPGLAERNRAFHREDSRWRDAVLRERELEALRAGKRHGLALAEPLLRLEWGRDGSRADLLHPRYGVVPYLGREDLLANLMFWRESPEPLRVAVLSGAGGFGKTRTAVEVCTEATRGGWTAGLLSVLRDGWGEQLRRFNEWPGRLMVAVDYAETRPDVVAALLAGLHARRQESPARVVLVTRQANTKDAVRRLLVENAQLDARLEVTGLIDRADVVRLDRDVVEVDRRELFAQASTAFAALLGVPVPAAGQPTLRAEHFGRPLYVLAAALLAVEDASLDVDDLATDDLLLEILDQHEAEYWDRWNQRLRVGLGRADQRRAVAWAAFLGAEIEDEALSLVRMLPGFEDATGERARQVAGWLAHLYGSGDLDAYPAISPLEPDLLAEALIARVLVPDGSG
jgi:trypsin-like peptidase